MYSLFDYGCMIADRGRTAAYFEALKQRVNPDSVVLEIGTGTGVLALMAARLGARKVYAIESSEVIEFARQLAAANHLTNRIRFIRGISTQIELPERVDVIVSDIHGCLPVFGQSLPSLADARERFLKTGGRLIPQCEVLWAALVEAPQLHQTIAGVWGSDVYGFDMTALRIPATSDLRKNYFSPDALITGPQCWTRLEYQTIQSPNVHGEVAWEIGENRTAHGFCSWFDWEGGESVSFSNSPLSKEAHIFGQAFFPWPTAVELHAGDHVAIGLQADVVGQDYVWRWQTRITGRDGQTRAASLQTTFEGTISTPELLRKRAHTYTPAISENGAVDLLILSRMGSGATLAQIAHEVSSHFPVRFPKWTDALTRVGELSVRYDA